MARRDIKDASELTGKASDVFVPIKLAASALDANRPIAEIDLASGIVRIFAGIDRHALHEVIAVLKAVTN